MTEPHEIDPIEELATESVAPVQDELRQRLVAELAEEDSLAVESALLKAFINGMRTGAGEVAERVIDNPREPAGFGPAGLSVGRAPTAGELDPQLPQLDPWAERHGDG